MIFNSMLYNSEPLWWWAWLLYMNRNSNRYFALSNMVASQLLSNESDMPVKVIRSWFQGCFQHEQGAPHY